MIGCGNPGAGDDGAGPAAVRAAQERLPDGVAIAEASTAVRVLDLLVNAVSTDGVELVILVDAIREPNRRRRPGSIVRMEAQPDGLPADPASAFSSHGVTAADAVALAAALGPLPPIVFFGIEVVDVSIGRGLTPPIRAALPALVDAVVAEVARIDDASISPEHPARPDRGLRPSPT